MTNLRIGDRFWACVLIVLVSSSVAWGVTAAAESARGKTVQEAATPNGDAVVRIYFLPGEDLAALARHLDVWEVHRAESYLVAAADTATIARLIAAGYRIEVDDEKTARLNQPLVALPGQVNGIPGYPCYRTVEETYASMQALATANPTLASWINIGESWERVAHGAGHGYDLNVLIVTNTQSAVPKARFFLMAEIHARELTTAETAARFAEYLVAGYGSDPDITWLLNYNEIHILVMTNPDGHKLAEQGYYQRKNTDNANGGNCSVPPTMSDQYGTDCNRNSNFHWGGSGTDPCEEEYQGPTAVSEPETAAMQNYVLSIFPDQRGPGDTDPAPPDTTGLLVTLHSYSDLVLWPWGFTSNPAPNATDLERLGRKFAFLNYYTPEQSVDLYPTTGTSDDWAYGELGIGAYTFEIGVDFFEDCQTFESTTYPVNRNALFYACKAARLPYELPAGPDTLNVAVANGVIPGGTVGLTATADATRYASPWPVQNVAAARFSVDTPSWEGGATQAMSPADGSFDQPVEGLVGTVNATGLNPGRHLVLVESQSAGGNWGPPSACFLCVAATNHAVTLQPPSDGRLGDPGNTVTYSLHLGNSGALNDTYNVSVAGNAWPVTAQASVGPVSPCGSSDFTVTVRIPASVVAGATDTATVTVTSQADATVSGSSVLTTTAQAGVTVNPTSGLVTTESGGTAQFTVVLTAQPAATVTIPLVSSDTTVGTIAPDALTFTPDDWNAPQTATTTGVQNFIAGGSIPYTIIVGPAVSADLLYNGLKPPDVSCTLLDDDVAGFNVTPTSGLVTTEAGGTATFTVSLTSEPLANVSIGLSSSDTTEGTVAPGILAFTPANWNTPQTVTVTGVPDTIVDGTIAYSIILAPAVSTDPVYNGLKPSNVSVENLDAQSADLRVVGQASANPVPINTPFTITFTVTDRGLLTATGTTLTATLPAGATLGSATASQGSCSGTGPVTCALGTLVMNGVATVTLQLTPTQTGTITTAASVSSAQPDPASSDNTVSVQTTVVAFGPTALAVDTIAYSQGSSNLNGVFEPGEIVVVAPTWKNYTAAGTAVTSTGHFFTGNAVTQYLYYHNGADYGTVPAGTAVSCADATSNCYAMYIGVPASRPVHFDATFVETLSTGTSKTWTLHVGNSFADVPPTRWAYSYIETMLHKNITAGCGNGNYCPGIGTSRWQMAVFLSIALAGNNVPTSGTVPGMGDYNCVSGGQSVFGDVAPTDSGCKFIHYIAAKGITSGCGDGDYCPSLTVDRWQMAVFVAKAIATGPIPVSGTIPGLGTYDCEAGGTSVFGDVPPTDGGCRFIHYIAANGITAGCGGGNYCPSATLNRDQMAVFITKGFNLNLYGP